MGSLLEKEPASGGEGTVDWMGVKGCKQRGGELGAGAERQPAFLGGQDTHPPETAKWLSEPQVMGRVSMTRVFLAFWFSNKGASPGGWTLGSGGYTGLEQAGQGLWGGEPCVNHAGKCPEYPTFETWGQRHHDASPLHPSTSRPTLEEFGDFIFFFSL